jgi:hypothetical protein
MARLKLTIRELRAVRLTLPQLSAVAAASAVATALILINATGSAGLQSAVLASLNRGVVIHRSIPAVPPVQAAAAPVASVQASNPSPSTPAAAVAPTSSSSSGSQASSSAAAASTTTTTQSATPTPKTSKVKHAFVIALSTTGYAAAFGPRSPARYLNEKLVPKGTLLANYWSLGRSALPDYLALAGGQAPNPDTRGECASYTEFPASAAKVTNAQVPGAGCVYPNTVTTIADQVAGAGKVWRAYLEDMGQTSCVSPASGAVDDAPPPHAGSQYDTRHNPFIYFHSLLDLGGCATGDVALDQLPPALRTERNTPSFSYVAPGLCEDASAPSCPGGAPGGLAAEDAFLKLWVPRILASAAYKRDGALMIVFTPPKSASGIGAGAPIRTGTLVLSRYAAAGRKLTKRYDAFSVLRAVEDLFGYTPLVHAKSAKSFAAAALPEA